MDPRRFRRKNDGSDDFEGREMGVRFFRQKSIREGIKNQRIGKEFYAQKGPGMGGRMTKRTREGIRDDIVDCD